MRNQDAESNQAAPVPSTDVSEVVAKTGTPKAGSFKWVRWSVLLILGSGMTWLAVFYFTPYRPSADEPNRSATVRKAAAKPASIESQLLGTWEDDYHGKRTLTLRPDGTGTMVCELAGWEAALFAKKLTFEEVWSVKDGALIMRVTGGEPKSKINFVLKREGDQTTQKILELTSKRLRVQDLKDKKKFDWRRVREYNSAEKSDLKDTSTKVDK
jgi:hypothetical protein